MKKNKYSVKWKTLQEVIYEKKSQETQLDKRRMINAAYGMFK